MSGHERDEDRDGGARDRGAHAGSAHAGGGERISRLEWLTAAVGLLLVLGAIVYLSYEAIAGDDAPPTMAVVADSVTAAGGVHQVHFTVRNQGDRAGAAVVVEGRLGGAGNGGDEGGGEGETSEVTLDYVPGRSERRGGLFFTGDPRAGGLELRVLGYSVP